VIVAVVFHSVSGRTRALAEAVARGAVAAGAEAHVVSVEEAPRHQDLLAEADAIVFGCPTYMGSASAPFKAFMDATSAVWALQGWRDKLAAAFTHSAAPSGDKLGTLTQLAVFAAQHGMVWVGLGLPPTYASAADPADDRNRLGSHLGAMAQSRPGGGVLPAGDVATAEHLGRRVGNAAARWGRLARSSSARHPATHAWVFPPAERAPLPDGIERTNLRELAARRERYEHHLLACATVDDVQLEIATASEPLYFAHINLSDEYAIALTTGDDLVDRFPLRTFVSDPRSGEDVARYNHRSEDLVLHPKGYLHWPGRQRAPWTPFDFPVGMRRCGLSLVYCASKTTAPTPTPLALPPDRAGDAKAYATPAPPLVLAPLHGDLGVVARIGRTTLTLLASPAAIAPLHGGWVVVLEASAGSPHAAGDLLRLPAGVSLPGAGIVRALVLASLEVAPDPVPPSWQAVPPAPFPPFEDGERGPLPVAVVHDALRVTEASPALVTVACGGASAAVPRHWLARMLFRIALHGLRVGYAETYGGFFVDDRDPAVRIGLRLPFGEPAEVLVPRGEALGVLERLYRAVAPVGYTERPI